MKKIIAAIAALSMSALMLTGCGDKTTTGDSVLTESITVPETAGGAAAADDAGDSNAAGAAGAADAAGAPEDDGIGAEYKPKSEANDDSGEDISGAVPSYASIEEFAKSSDIFDHDGDAISAEDSYTYAFLENVEGASKIYINMEAIDGSLKILMAVESDRLAMIIEGDFGDNELNNIGIIAADGKMYMLDVSTKSGIVMNVSDEEFSEAFAEVNPEELFSDLGLSDDSTGYIMRYKAEIGGRTYFFEFDGKSSDMGMLYDSDGDPCAMIGDGFGIGTSTLIINDFGTDVPESAFKIPPGYEIVDLSALAD